MRKRKIVVILLLVPSALSRQGLYRSTWQ